jgi:hypothetical protein
MNVATILGKAKKIAQAPALLKAGSEAKQGLLDGATDIATSVLSKQGLATGALALTAGTMIAHKKGAISTDEMKDAAGIIGLTGATLAGLALGGKGASRLIRKARGLGEKTLRGTAVDNFANNLRPDPFNTKKHFSFYQGGALGQAGAIAEEAIRGTHRIGSRFFSRKDSIASRMAGINKLEYKLLNDTDIILRESEGEIQRLINTPITKQFTQKVQQIEVNKVVKGANEAVQVMFAQLTNNYSNAFMYTGKGKRGLETFMKEFVSKTSYSDLVKQANASGMGEEALNNLIKVQGSKNISTYLKVANRGMRQGGDALRNIQFDNRSYKLFSDMNEGVIGKKAMIEEATSIFGKNAVKRLKNGSVQIIFSPQHKSNIDWGGFAGTMVWNPAKAHRSKIIMMGDDLRDLWGMNFGKDVLNVSEIKTISIPKILKEVKLNKVIEETGGKVAKRYKQKVLPEDITTIQRKMKMRGEDWDRAMVMRDKYAESLKLSASLDDNLEFFGTRIGAVLGAATPVGVYALAVDD